MIARTRKMMMRAVLLAVLVAPVSPVFAAGPDLMNYNGFLRDDMGNPINGSPELTFRIYNAESGGTLLWGEGHGPVPVVDGVFSVVLGEIRAMDETLFDGSRWIETVVDGEPMVPRRPILSTPYAMRATVADVALSGGGDDDDWVVDGNNVYRQGGAVGINTSNVGDQALYVAGDIQIGGGFDGVADSNAESIVLWGASREWYIGVQNEANPNASDFFIGPSQEDGTFHIETGGDIGIGTTSPSAKLDVLGDVEADFSTARRDLGDADAPRLGTTYRDNVVYAWANIRGDGAVLSSYGVESVQRTGPGRYTVHLHNTLPNGVAATVTGDTANDPVLATARAYTDRVDVVTWLFIPGNNNFATSDYRFFIQVTGRP